MLTLRSDFPLLLNNPNLIYLDTAASAQKPSIVIDSITNFYSTSYANVHRGIYDLSTSSTELYESARLKVSKFINASSYKEIIFTRSATESLNLVSTSLSNDLNEGDEIILSVLEHHANLIPWQIIAKKKNLTLKFAYLNSDGEIDLHHIAQLISSRTQIVSLSHCSNVLGTITPFSHIKKLLIEKGSTALLIADASQSVAHIPLSVQELQVDFLVFSSHKLYGPSGVGLLWGREQLLLNLPPYQTGGDMIRTVTLESSTWNELPWKFEAGTPNIEGAVGLGAAIDYLQNVGMDSVLLHTIEITLHALQSLKEIQEVVILGNPNPICGIISFTVKGMHPHDIASLLNEHAICIRAGHHCAAPLHHYLGLAASNRVSIGLYTSSQDIDLFISALKKIINDFNNV